MIHDSAPFVKNITDKFSQRKACSCSGRSKQQDSSAHCKMHSRKLTENKRICYDKSSVEKQLTRKILLVFPLRI